MKSLPLISIAFLICSPALRSAEIYKLRESELTITPHGAVSANLSSTEIKRIMGFFDSISTLERQNVLQFCTPLISDEKSDSTEKAKGSTAAVDGLIKEYSSLGKNVSYRLSFVRESEQKNDTILVIAYYIRHQDEGDSLAMGKRYLFKYSKNGTLYWHGN